jgi:hypothetical protein
MKKDYNSFFKAPLFCQNENTNLTYNFLQIYILEIPMS